MKTDVPQESVLKGPGFRPASQKADAPDVRSGEKVGRARGMGGDVVLGVTTKDGRIASVRVIEANETPGIGTKALEKLPDEAVRNNGKVDTVSGATVTSDAFRSALKDALR